MNPNIFISFTTVSFWCRFIIFLLLCFRILTCTCFSWFCNLGRSWLLYFYCFLSLLGLLLSLSFLFFLFDFSLFFSFLLFPFFLLLFLLSLLIVFLKIDSAVVDNDLFCFFLVGKKVGISSKEAKDPIKEAVNGAFLLDHGH